MVEFATYPPNPDNIGAIAIPFGDGSTSISNNTYTLLPVDFSFIIKSVTIVADQTGSITIDILQQDYDDYLSTYTSICGGNKPAISSSTKFSDSLLSNWTTAINLGSVLKFNVDSNSSITNCTITLQVIKVASV
jgi:hypothetical protein